MDKPIIIVGAGLSGLQIASQLAKQNIRCKVLEARDRIGGRVMSTTPKEQPDLGRFDLGASWFWPDHETIITNLIKELGLETFEQYTKGNMILERSSNQTPERYLMPSNTQPRSLRIAGGMDSLVHALADLMPSDIVERNTNVTAIRMDENGDIIVEAEYPDGQKAKLSADSVVLALPPRIIAQNIVFSPSLPKSVINDLRHKPTWMAGQAKAIAIYDYPFWRDLGLSGFASSLVGPLQEIHDASPQSGSGALFGFFGIPASNRQELGADAISNMVIQQLSRLFGPAAQNVREILYKDWSEDIETSVKDDYVPFRNYPAYGPPSTLGIWEKKIIMASTEMSSHFGGHLEGALYAAGQAVKNIIELKNESR